MDIEFGMLAFICAMFLAAVLTGIITKKNHKKNHDEHGIPFGKEDNYLLALEPCKDGKPLMYDLTTCRHCVRVQEFLAVRGVEFNDVLVDTYIGKAREEILTKLRSYNPKASFPTVVFPDGSVVVGYREAQLLEAVENFKNSQS